jgi:hypothetical protein
MSCRGGVEDPNAVEPGRKALQALRPVGRHRAMAPVERVGSHVLGPAGLLQSRGAVGGGNARWAVKVMFKKRKSKSHRGNLLFSPVDTILFIMSRDKFTKTLVNSVHYSYRSSFLCFH